MYFASALLTPMWCWVTQIRTITVNYLQTNNGTSSPIEVNRAGTWIAKIYSMQSSLSITDLWVWVNITTLVMKQWSRAPYTLKYKATITYRVIVRMTALYLKVYDPEQQHQCFASSNPTKVNSRFRTGVFEVYLGNFSPCHIVIIKIIGLV